MTRDDSFTIGYEGPDGAFSLFKIIFGADGSYFVTAPYHPHESALLTMVTVNYTKQESFSLKSALQQDSIEVATLDSDDQRLKLSHHPDGFLQFSGEGIVSGRDANGKAKGLGVKSWPLAEPTFGPSFGVVFQRPHLCGRPGVKQPALVFSEEELEFQRRDRDVLDVGFQGYYFPPRLRSFIRFIPGRGPVISIVNPTSQAILEMRVVLAPPQVAIGGFIGVTAFAIEADVGSDSSGYILSSSTGSLRRNTSGELLGDALIAIAPRPPDPDLIPVITKSLHRPLNAPPYQAPPGVTDILPEARLPVWPAPRADRNQPRSSTRSQRRGR